MPTYNAERYIGASIESILKQTFSDFELIIVDNASTDSTSNICRKAAATDRRVRYCRNDRNLGAAENYNLALRMARAPYFKWSSSNDLHHPEFLRVCMDALQREQTAVLAHTQTIVFENEPDDGKLYAENLGLDVDDPQERFLRFLDRLRLNNIMNGVFLTDPLRRAPAMKPLVGADLVTTAAMTLRGKIVEVPVAYFYRRMDPGSATRLRGEDAVRTHYDPDSTRRMLFQLWRLKLAYFVMVASSPLPAATRLSLFGALLRRLVWSRQALLDDAVTSIRQMLKPRRIRTGRN